MKKCKIKLNETMYLGDDADIVIPPGIYDGYEEGINMWPEIEYNGELYDFVDDEIDVEFLNI